MRNIDDSVYQAQLQQLRGYIDYTHQTRGNAGITVQAKINEMVANGDAMQKILDHLLTKDEQQKFNSFCTQSNSAVTEYFRGSQEN